MTFLLNLPFYQLLAVLVLGSVLLTYTLQALIYRFIPIALRESNNDVIAFTFSSLGVFSVLIISSVFTMGMSHFNDASDAVSKEANSLADLGRVGYGISTEFGRELTLKTLPCLKIISVLEWDTAHRAENLNMERNAVNELAKFIGQYNPITPRETIYHQALLDNMMKFQDARRNRNTVATNSIAPQMLVVALVVGFLTLLFVLLYGAKNKRMHFILTSLLAAAMATTFALIFAFDSPFQGDLVVSNEPYLTIMENNQKNIEWQQKAATALPVNK